MLATRFFSRFCKFTVTMVILVLGVTACGYRGALYLPPETEKQRSTESSDATTGQPNQAEQSSEDEPH
ncbi:LPS translocon maturation chaperone LptM [Alteromonas oceanisediminis]|uniref:LPS translocon maturation chaperone LptM n=1 Tax=Alteromonas oceanisediminis TaxID=2836180 RepID=UPI001BDAA8B4|nr:lipoprotein [Alteromonas oceanisediminis]MBT0586848.1 lipoprotein [Alteromonas oceanisediminis]